MHSTEGSNNGVPGFLTKLWKLVDDKKFEDLIYWSPNGKSFVIHQQSKFAKDVLPLYFKHNNMASFIRQLNMYGFHKVAYPEQGDRNVENDIEFFNPYFIKEQESLLSFIKRKIPTTRTSTVTHVEEMKPEMVSEILSDVQALKGKQESVDSLLTNMKRENEALWREVAYLRQKHLKQQQIVEKLIQFLVTLVQPNGVGSVNMGVVKRKVPLMLYNNTSIGPTEAKLPRLARQISSTIGNPGSSTGPVIHDVTDALDPKPLFSTDASEKLENKTISDDYHSDALLTDTILPNPDEPDETLETAGMNFSPSPVDNLPVINSPSVSSPLAPEDTIEPLSILIPLETPDIDDEPVLSLGETSSEKPVASRPSDLSFNVFASSSDNVLNTPQMELFEPILSKLPEEEPKAEEKDREKMTLFSSDNKMQVALSDSLSKYRKGNTPLERNHLNEHLDGIDSELDWLQDQLSGSTLNFDVSSLLSLFSADDTVPGNNLSADSLKFTGSVTGNEVVQYNLPTLQDLEIMDDSNEGSHNTLDLETTEPSSMDHIADFLLAANNNPEISSAVKTNNPKHSFNNRLKRKS